MPRTSPPCAALLTLFLVSAFVPVATAVAQAQEGSAQPAVVATAASNQPAAPGKDSKPQARRPNSRWARAELATVQTIIGAAVGAEVCALAECEKARPWAGAVILGAGGGLTLSLLTTRDGISQGRALAVNSGTLFGTWLGVGTFLLTSGSDPSARHFAGLAIGGQLLGAGLGLAADNYLTLSPGEVSLANSGALWTGVGSLMALAAINPDSDGDQLRRRFIGTSLATTSLGLVGGAWLARRDRVSRGRAFMVDAGAIAGGGLFPLVGWFVRGEQASSAALLWSSVAGSLGGAVTAYVLTRTWDAPEAPNLSMSVSPTQGGGIAQLTFKM